MCIDGGIPLGFAETTVQHVRIDDPAPVSEHIYIVFVRVAHPLVDGMDNLTRSCVRAIRRAPGDIGTGGACRTQLVEIVVHPRGLYGVMGQLIIGSIDKGSRLRQFSVLCFFRHICRNAGDVSHLVQDIKGVL